MDAIGTIVEAKEIAHSVTMYAIEFDGITTITGVYFNCPSEQRRKTLQAWANETLASAASAGLDTNSPNFTLLAVSLESCGGRAMYRTVDDIPLVNVPCPCGDSSHWLVRWSE